MHETYEPVIIITDNHKMSNNRLAVLVYQTEPSYNKPHMIEEGGRFTGATSLNGPHELVMTALCQNQCKHSC